MENQSEEDYSDVTQKVLSTTICPKCHLEAKALFRKKGEKQGICEDCLKAKNDN